MGRRLADRRMIPRLAAALALILALAIPLGAGAVPGSHTVSGSGVLLSSGATLTISGSESPFPGGGTATYIPQGGSSVTIALNCVYVFWAGGFPPPGGVHRLHARGVGSDGATYYIAIDDQGPIDQATVLTAPDPYAQCNAPFASELVIPIPGYTISP